MRHKRHPLKVKTPMQKRTAARHTGARQVPWPHEHTAMIAVYHSVGRYDPDNDGDSDAPGAADTDDTAAGAPGGTA